MWDIVTNSEWTENVNGYMQDVISHFKQTACLIHAQQGLFPAGGDLTCWNTI
jgi:hypothetical protein